eukprot:3185108-Pleurochrysis_carterae.AAC.3
MRLMRPAIPASALLACTSLRSKGKNTMNVRVDCVFTEWQAETKARSSGGGPPARADRQRGRATINGPQTWGIHALVC